LNVLGLNYELYKSKIYIQTGLRYNSAKNYITVQENLDNNGVYHITYLNASRYSSATVSLNASYDVFNWWKITMYGSMRYNMYEDNNIPRLNKNFWTPAMWLQSNVNYKRLYVSVLHYFSFRQATLTGYTKYSGMGESSISVSYRLNNSWSLTGMLRYLEPVRFKTETFGDGFSEIYYENITDRYFRVLFGFNYNFQKGKQQQYRQKKVKNYNDEVNIEAKSY
jgi:hypothetical protein